MRVLAYILIGVLGGIGVMMFSTGEREHFSLLSPVGHAQAAPETEDPKLETEGPKP
ncbi:MAG: hypothetical protein MRJ67_17125 [Nitrospirales bacterium]|nr:hypothetical protein [Nitrospirales bacterium]